ncbi:sce7726 family protein [Sinorhizobium meliloti]|uniref:sce7726 family protein n=1 Tax=Rhizobium meliloti TaxID=382 RepID=UPI000B49F7DC|nr:sce7726 family protein [Sinorhizobium meliloti]ASP96722.1 hypothetical protein CDO24_04295 [Sinorhizobium meliloti]MDW9705628.1 sce7726 family protein [Sinorhizobium meliloti]MDW9935366.1 sce7726 family protein [Sinorhizobium meliloti]MDX0101722.1 sce7726 family protein [Sinorhizobium meliloti]MDX0120523.1 sce7726 family protein [Sinorhizobium meliloti]
MKTDEDGLKCELLSKFRRDRIITASATVASEFVLGQTGCRSDLAIWNGNFIGVEVKSARDSLSRLPDQINAYRRFFDRVVVLCDEIHLRKVEQLCSDEVGVYVWVDEQLQVVRDASFNYGTDRDECVRSLSLKQLQACLGLKPSDRCSRSELEQRIAADLSIDVRSLVVAAFETTYKTTTEAFLREISGRRIRKPHLAHLSRFAASRADARLSLDARNDFWRRWEQQAQTLFG